MYGSHYHLVEFSHTLLLYIKVISEDQKPIVKNSWGNSKFPGGGMPGINNGCVTAVYLIQLFCTRKNNVTNFNCDIVRIEFTILTACPSREDSGQTSS